MNTLKSGIKAYYDSFAGLVPVKVLTVTGPKEIPLFDLGHGFARASIEVTVMVTENHGCYRKGEIIESNSLHIVPCDVIKHNKYSTTIGVYHVEID